MGDGNLHCQVILFIQDYLRQLTVLNDIADQIVAGNKSIVGFMLESNLNAGKQVYSLLFSSKIFIMDGSVCKYFCVWHNRPYHVQLCMFHLGT